MSVYVVATYITCHGSYDPPSFSGHGRTRMHIGILIVIDGTMKVLEYDPRRLACGPMYFIFARCIGVGLCKGHGRE